MTLGQIHHMDVVPDAGAVVGGVVVAEYAQLLELAHGNLGDIGHQVVGNAVGILADGAALVGADGVEVAKEHHIPLGVGLLNVGEHLLEHGLGLAVGVGDGALRAVLGDGHGLRRAVDGGGGGEDDVFEAVLAHHVHQHQRTADVVLVVLPGLLDGLAHGLEAGKVDAAVKGVLGKYLFQAFPVADVHLVEGDGLAYDLLHPVNGLGGGVGEIVHDYGIMAGCDELDEGVAADKTGAARDKNVHSEKFLPILHRTGAEVTNTSVIIPYWLPRGNPEFYSLMSNQRISLASSDRGKLEPSPRKTVVSWGS